MIHRYLQAGGALFAVGLLLVQLQGPWLVFKLQQEEMRSEIKQRIKAGVPEEDLVTLKIPKAWETKNNERFTRIHSKEFRLDGEMYDIMRALEVGDTLVYVCIHDVKESGLFAQLDQLVEEENQGPLQREKRKKVEDTLSQKFFPAQSIVAFQVRNRTMKWFIPESKRPSYPQDNNAPPPEHVA